MTSLKLTASSIPGNEPTISCSIALPAVKKSFKNEVKNDEFLYMPNIWVNWV